MTTINYQQQYEELLTKYEELLHAYAEALRGQMPPAIVYSAPSPSVWPAPVWQPTPAGSCTAGPLPEPARVWPRIPAFG